MMLKLYSTPCIQTFPAYGHAKITVRQLSRNDTLAIEDAISALCKRIREWVDDGTLEDRVEFVPDVELSFKNFCGEAEEEYSEEETVSEGVEAPLDLLDYDTARRVDILQDFFN